MRDITLEFSAAQAITASAASDKYLDPGVVVNTGFLPQVEANVGTAFTGTAGTTLTIAVQVAASAAFSPVKTLAQSPPIDVSALTANSQILLPIPHNFDPASSYMRLYYTASASFSTGTISAGIEYNPQTNR
jgi:hypothetical protein